MRGLLATKKLFSSASAQRRKKEEDCYLKNGRSVLEELLVLCDGNCRIPIRYFSAIEIERAVKHSKSKMELSDVSMVTGSLDNRPVLVRFNKYQFINIHRDIAITAQMSHLKNVLRLVGCCLEFEEPVMVYEYVEGKSLSDLLFKSSHVQSRKSLSWGNRLRIACEVASAVVFLHTEFTTPIIHRDIKPHIVIIDQNSSVAKIVDFSLSISLPPGELEVEDELCGTIRLLTGKKAHDIMKSDVEEGDVIDRVDSAISEETVDLEEDIESNVVEGNSMDRVDSAMPEETIFENLPPNLIDHCIKEGNIMDIVDPAILEECGIDIRRQLEDYLDLVKKCTADEGEDRPYMIEVAKELCRMHKCFRALTLGQN